MFLIRQAGPRDFRGVYSLAQCLDSYNLPANRSYIRQLLVQSEKSFAGKLPKSQAYYLFVLEDLSEKSSRSSRIVGCSLIIAKHGTPGKPHLWFSLDQVVKKSRTVQIKRFHQVLRLGFTEDGPTEVGGLVVLPSYRKHANRCGLKISYVRFLYMAMHPDRFEKNVLVEYRGALGRGNRSPFWEKVGRVFTGLPYQKADHLSVSNKEFILSLLPHEPIYCALLPRSVQEAIGAIHPAAQRAAHLLEKIGFRPLPQIEPFDGGPYYMASRRKIRLIQQIQRVRVRPMDSFRSTNAFLVGTDQGGFFRAIVTEGTLVKGSLTVEKEACRFLHIEPGGWVYGVQVAR